MIEITTSASGVLRKGDVVTWSVRLTRWQVWRERLRRLRWNVPTTKETRAFVTAVTSDTSCRAQEEAEA